VMTIAERSVTAQRFDNRAQAHTSSSATRLEASLQTTEAQTSLSQAGISQTVATPGTVLLKSTDYRASLSAATDLAGVGYSNGALDTESASFDVPGPTLAERLSTETAQLSGKSATETWLKEIGLNVSGMVQGKLGRMSLQLHPAELGALEIEILTNDGTASIDFVATQAGTRELLESSLPRLRELLQQQGLQLGAAVVRDQTQQQQSARDQQQSRQILTAGRDDEPATDAIQLRQPRIDRNALLDAYA